MLKTFLRANGPVRIECGEIGAVVDHIDRGTLKKGLLAPGFYDHLQLLREVEGQDIKSRRKIVNITRPIGYCYPLRIGLGTIAGRRPGLDQPRADQRYRSALQGLK